MSDWIPPPVIDNALIIFIDSSVEEDSPGARELEDFIVEASRWSSVYLFADPDEDGELPLWLEAGIGDAAVAAHTADTMEENIFLAVRRITSRAETDRVLVIPVFAEAPTVSDVRTLFVKLESQPAVLQWEAGKPSFTAIGWTRPDHANLANLPWSDRDALITELHSGTH